MRRAKSASTTPFPITFASNAWVRRCCVLACFVNPHSSHPTHPPNSPGLRRCFLQLHPQERVNRKRLAAAATKAHCSPASPLPPFRKTLWGARLKGPGRCLQAVGQPVGRASTGKGNSLCTGWGTAVTAAVTTVSQGVSEEGGLSHAGPWWGEAALSHSPHLEARGV